MSVVGRSSPVNLQLRATGQRQHPLHSISTEQYIELAAWSATLARPGKHHLESPSAAAKTLGCDEAQWREQLNAVRCGWRVVGAGVQMPELALRIGQQRFKRRSRWPDPDRDAPRATPPSGRYSVASPRPDIGQVSSKACR